MARAGFCWFSRIQYRVLQLNGQPHRTRTNCHVWVYQPRQPYDASRFYIRISEDHFVYLLGQSRGRAHSRVDPVFVPEPSTYALLAVGCAGLLALRRRKQVT